MTDAGTTEKAPHKLPVRTLIGTHSDGTVKETVVIEKHEVVRLIRTAIALNEVGTAPARKA